MPRLSPPPYPQKPVPRPAPRSIPFRRSRYIYLTLAAVFLYLLVTGYSPLSLLPYRSPKHSPSLQYKNVDWSRYAYFQYATSSAYLCNSVMIFEALNRLGSKADRILIYPERWDTQIESQSDRDSQLLVKARDWYNVRLVPVDLPIMHDKDEQDRRQEGSFIKFAAWNTARYDRVLYLASDITILKPVDELFLLPRTPVAMMREHWSLPDKKLMTSRVILLQPSEDEFERLSTSVRADIRQNGDNDTEILNRFYGDSAMILPHQAYGLLSREFRTDDHRYYVGNTYDLWDPEKVMREASLVHFIDEPFPKPWVMWHHRLLAEKHPQCHGEDCRNKDAWMSLYDDFRKRRKDICALLSATAPEWPPRNSTKKPLV
ncbi:MAG: hypothetical protein L6R40_007702 [Gallowayella cf. fulva]|nr:MAG: hypothetical protein L6R40_007702 [Xanthomendoza cf. fulva]